MSVNLVDNLANLREELIKEHNLCEKEIDGIIANSRMNYIEKCGKDLIILSNITDRLFASNLEPVVIKYFKENIDPIIIDGKELLIIPVISKDSINAYYHFIYFFDKNVKLEGDFAHKLVEDILENDVKPYKEDHK